MKFIKIVNIGFKNLTINKMRTGLAVLGIVIGIGSVIALMSLGDATRLSVQARIQSIGSNLLTITPGAASLGMIRGVSQVTTLTVEDAHAISQAKTVTTIKRVSPEYATRTQVVAGAYNTNTQVVGVTPSYREVRKISLSSGSFITEQHLVSLSKVAVLGPNVVEDLFNGVNPVGLMVRIQGQTFQVIGITATKGGTGFNSQDDMIYIPLSTAQKQLYGAKHVTAIYAEATSDQVMTRAQNQIGYLLLERHKLNDPSEADFRIMSQADILETASAVAGSFTTLLTGVAAISLLVGGIGIMNIMLMSVTERTREIGLRKALGAKKKDIVTQFLVEAVILTFAGGIIGIILGISGYFAYAKVNNAIFIVSPPSVLLAFIVSAVIGILFGWYPAQRAANLQPIEALRYE